MSYCLIDSKNFLHNINVIKKHVDINKIAFVLKNNAYGHGLVEMAKLAKQNKIKHAVVINHNEAEKIIDYFDSILVLSGQPSQVFSEKISIAINEIEDIYKIPSGAHVELKVDTGMHRNGVPINQLEKCLKSIDDVGLILIGVFTHFANAFENDGSMEKQKVKFDNIVEKIKNRKFDNRIRFHCSSSPGVFRFDNNEYDMTRIGIAMYGYVDLPDSVTVPNLKPVLSLWAEKISSRLVEKGQCVGYGGVFQANSDMNVSTYDIGYGNGFFRLDENKKFQISDGRDILGRVSMNNLAVEGIDKEICIFDNVKELAKIHQTISYEILCRIDSEIDRRVI